MKNGNFCDCNRKNAMKFGGFKKKLYLCNWFAKTFMTNNDFWKHIDTIIAQGFDAHGLKQLEEYAELF